MSWGQTLAAFERNYIWEIESKDHGQPGWLPISIAYARDPVLKVHPHRLN
jgi:hypothetical protein